jgi:hypothetical protein
MKKNQALIIASLLALILGIAIFARSYTQKQKFDRTVQESLKTTEGYDQRFIDMVNRLENILATRASFGYTGGKDPMTGIKRQVVQPIASAPSKAPAGMAEEPKEQVDPVKLTAIIQGQDKNMTAIIMDGERSFAVEAGDNAAGRKITRITNEGIYMENDSMYYYYDIYGKKATKQKENRAAAPATPAPPPAPQAQ